MCFLFYTLKEENRRVNSRAYCEFIFDQTVQVTCKSKMGPASVGSQSVSATTEYFSTLGITPGSC